MSLEQKFAPEQISLYHKSSRKREAGLCSTATTGFELFFHSSSITLAAERREINASLSTLMSIVESFHHQLLLKTMKNGRRLPGNQKTSRSHWKKIIHDLSF